MSLATIRLRLFIITSLKGVSEICMLCFSHRCTMHNVLENEEINEFFSLTKGGFVMTYDVFIYIV